MDLKMVLILCGKQAASCKHPCPYCTSSSPWKEKGRFETLTLGMLKDFHKEFLKACGNDKKAQLYNNVVNKPLLKGEDSKKVISLVNFPELHVLTGVVGKLIKELQRQAFKSE